LPLVIRIVIGMRSMVTPRATVSRKMADPMTVPRAICGRRSRAAMTPVVRFSG
jgi:hypothetical protein